MTTTIAPGLGHAPMFTQGGVGAAPGYDAVDFRRALSDPLQEGVRTVGTGAWLVTQRGAGANMSVDIAANVDMAYVLGDSVALQGLYPVAPHSAVINEAITAADPTNPRIDRVILEIQDNAHDASGGNLARTRVVNGVATSGATLANLSGAAAMPSSALLLANVLVGAGVLSITTANADDKRTSAVIGPPILGALPTSPPDGMVFSYVADATNGVIWTFRYRAASASVYKWEAVGGASPLTAETNVNESVATAVGTYVDLTTVGPSITAPLAGDYLISFSATASPPTSGTARIAPRIGAGSIASNVDDAGTNNTTSGSYPTSRELRRNVGAAGTVVKLQYSSDGSGTAVFNRRTLSIRPIRVG